MSVSSIKWVTCLPYYEGVLDQDLQWTSWYNNSLPWSTLSSNCRTVVTSDEALVHRYHHDVPNVRIDIANTIDRSDVWWSWRESHEVYLLDPHEIRPIRWQRFCILCFACVRTNKRGHSKGTRLGCLGCLARRETPRCYNTTTLQHHNITVNHVSSVEVHHNIT